MMLIDADCISTKFFPNPGGRVLSSSVVSRMGRTLRVVVSGWAPAEAPSWTAVLDTRSKHYPSRNFSLGISCVICAGITSADVEPRFMHFPPSSMARVTKEEVEGFEEKRT